MNRRTTLLVALVGTALMATAGCQDETVSVSGTSVTQRPPSSTPSTSVPSPRESTTSAPPRDGVEPSNGVLPSIDKMPMPVAGKRYDNPQPRHEVKQGGTLTLPMEHLPTDYNTFDVNGNTYANDQIDFWTNTSPWRYTVGGTVSPNTDYFSKVEVVSRKPETVKVTINPKATWNNGDPITWKAIETAWKTQSRRGKKYYPNSSDGYDKIASVTEGDDAKQAVVKFRTPTYPYQLAINLEHPKNLDPTFYNQGWSDDPHSELRAGPYTIRSASERKIVLVPNDKWWGPRPKLDKIVYRQMDDALALGAFKNGKIDALSLSSAADRRKIDDMSGVRVERGFRTANTVLTLGKDSPLFEHAYARKAFEFAIDREKIVEKRFYGMDWTEKPLGSELLYPWQDGYEDNMAGLGYDPAKSKKLMESHGWTIGDDGYYQKDGKTATFTYVTFSGSGTAVSQARTVQSAAQKVGLKMTIDTRSTSQFYTALEKKDFDVIAMGWTASDPFGPFWACQMYCTDSGSNYSGVGDTALDRKLKKPQTVADPARAAELGNEAEVEALKLAGTFPLYNGPETYAVKSGLANSTNAMERPVSGFYTAKPYNVGWQKK